VSSHSLGISGNSLYSWGFQGNGRLGDGVSANANVTVPKLIDSNTTWTQVSAGGDHSFGISGGMLYGWGRNNSGQVGNGTQLDVLTPTEVGGGSTAWTYIAAGREFSAGICGGSLYTWGLNFYGNLGLGDTTTRTSPTRVDSSSNWTKVACLSSSGVPVNQRYMFMLGISGGSLYACGDDQFGQLGVGGGGQRNRFVRVGSLTGWVDVGGSTPFWISSHAIRQTVS
jgi:alpha-tubulin suppressor-like RCC1 family protein